MCNKKGFSLIEVMIATLVLIIGIAGVSGMFAYSARTNFYTEQLTTGILLANDKAEELGARTLSGLGVGGGLDATSPVSGYFQYIDVAPDGTITRSTSDTSLQFLCMWQISGGVPRLITVSIVALRSGVTGRRVELIRTTTEASS